MRCDCEYKCERISVYTIVIVFGDDIIDKEKKINFAAKGKVMVMENKNKSYGVTQNYDRNLYDDTRKKEQFKDETFEGKKTIKDPKSGQVLHRSHSSAKKKYHTKWARHAAETDHIKSLKEFHDSAKHNPFLTDEDVKTIANSRENYQILSKSENASKSNKTMVNNSSIKQTLSANVTLHGKFAKKTVENATKDFFISGAKDTLINSVIPLTAKAVEEMVQVATGEKSFQEATSTIAKHTLKTAVTGGSYQVLQHAVNTHLKNSGNTLLKSISGNQLAQIITVANVVQDSAMRYFGGEISGKEFVEEIGSKGAVIVAGMIGSEIGGEIGSIVGGILGTGTMPFIGTGAGIVAGRVVGEILGTIITTVACSGILGVYEVYQHRNDYLRKEKQIKTLEREALAEISAQRKKFQQIVQQEFACWDKTVQSGFDRILSCACEENYDLNGVTQGIDKILSLFGKSVAFKTLDEYEQQLDKPLIFSFS